MHLIRASLRYASKKDRGLLTKHLRVIYTAVDETAAEARAWSLRRRPMALSYSVMVGGADVLDGTLALAIKRAGEATPRSA